MQQVSPTSTTTEALEEWEPPAVTEYLIAEVSDATFVAGGADGGIYS
ncbi:hypothetical protein ABIE65_002156 [Constrictibacter sp. MBR-5]|jgi:hypothetical protein